MEGLGLQFSLLTELSVFPETCNRLSQPTAFLFQGLLYILEQLLLCIQPLWALLGPNRSSLPNGMTGECRNELENKAKYDCGEESCQSQDSFAPHWNDRMAASLCLSASGSSLWLPVILALWPFPSYLFGFPKDTTSHSRLGAEEQASATALMQNYIGGQGQPLSSSVSLVP